MATRTVKVVCLSSYNAPYTLHPNVMSIKPHWCEYCNITILSDSWQSLLHQHSDWAIVMCGVTEGRLGKAGLLGGDVAPLLHHGLLHLPGVSPGPGAPLLGHIHTLLGGFQLGHQLGDVLAGPLR